MVDGDRSQAKLTSGGHKGTESEFGRCAEEWGIPLVTLSFEGHSMEHAGGEVVVLGDTELAQGDVSMTIVFQRLGRTFHRGKGIRRVIQSLYHIVSRGDALFVVGWVQPDDTVKGGTGWGVELAKFFNREISVFDQGTNQWMSFKEGHWQADEPVIPNRPFSATGTRNLSDAGRAAIRALFERSFGAPKESA